MFENISDIQVLTMVFTFIGVLVIGAAKYYERKVNAGETWSDAKFGMFFIVAALVMAFEYMYSGAVEFPAEETIAAMLAILTPIFSLFGATYSTLIAGKLFKKTIVQPTLASLAAPAAETTGQGFSQGFTVTPTYTEGESPVPVTFKIYATQVQPDHPGVTSVDVDWGDNQSQNVPLVKGYAEVSHIFTFTATPKYTGHTFFPIFAFNGSDGSKTYFNVDGKGVEIWVQA